MLRFLPILLLLFGCVPETKCNQYGDVGLCIASPEALNEKAYPVYKEGLFTDDTLTKSVKKKKIRGLYDFKNKEVWLRDDVDLNQEKWLGILIHELVHYIQYEMDLDALAANKDELEPLALEIESLFIAMLRRRREEE